ncbi:hypothetical protein B9G69_005195 [Bdellovibrio sp. SKB1291214]|uniref:hypothetical protein n=1 Tax=Bdellovibrio sp. SKB1291214 TaxID=1732569 RepID=UPI001130B5EF|nr:hypothetical protein [Bdellovibrio sp. SKB1291214]UYL09970.1 hypothetical protein B9G69_005195 [Bdellovibrio sp. SKB1291214]
MRKVKFLIFVVGSLAMVFGAYFWIWSMKSLELDKGRMTEELSKSYAECSSWTDLINKKIEGSLLAERKTYQIYCKIVLDYSMRKYKKIEIYGLNDPAVRQMTIEYIKSLPQFLPAQVEFYHDEFWENGLRKNSESYEQLSIEAVVR